MILVTGGSGFIGSAVINTALAMGKKVRASLRHIDANAPANADTVLIGNLDGNTDWSASLKDIEAIIHTAARVHIMHDAAADPLAEFRRVNVEGTLNLARQAAASGVKRFVFVSSIKVNGEATRTGVPFTADDAAAPQDAYGLSKYEAEIGLHQLAAMTGMEIVIVRPPLVYGPGVKANFAAMMRLLSSGLPLPLGAVNGNRRSLVALDNLGDLLLKCIDYPAAVNQTFLVSDGEDLSTTELLRRAGRVMGKQGWLLPVPPKLLQFAANTLGKADVAQRLLGSLQVDITKTRELLGWTPPISVNEGLRRAAQGLLK